MRCRVLLTIRSLASKRSSNIILANEFVRIENGTYSGADALSTLDARALRGSGCGEGGGGGISNGCSTDGGFPYGVCGCHVYAGMWPRQSIPAVKLGFKFDPGSSVAVCMPAHIPVARGSGGASAFSSCATCSASNVGKLTAARPLGLSKSDSGPTSAYPPKLGCPV